MKNMLDYISESLGTFRFEERAFSEIDALVLTELSVTTCVPSVKMGRILSQ